MKRNETYIWNKPKKCQFSSERCELQETNWQKQSASSCLLWEEFCCTLYILIIVALYVVIGGFILFVLERDMVRNPEVSDCTRNLAKSIEILWNNSRHLTKDSWIRAAAEAFRKESKCDQSVAFLFTSDTRTPRTFVSALSCSFSAVTTIGWTNVAPQSQNGKLFIIAFSFFGIPLMLILLNQMGRLWRIVLKFFSIRFQGCCLLCRKVHLQDRDHDPCCVQCQQNSWKAKFFSRDHWEPSFGITLAIFVAYLLLGCYILCLFDTKRSSFDEMYFLFISMSTIGFKELSMPKSFYPFLFVYLVFGLSLLAINIEIVENILVDIGYFCSSNLRKKSNSQCALCLRKEADEFEDEEFRN